MQNLWVSHITAELGVPLYTPLHAHALVQYAITQVQSAFLSNSANCSCSQAVCTLCALKKKEKEKEKLLCSVLLNGKQAKCLRP